MYSSFNWEKFENWKEALDVLEGRSHDKVVVKYLKEGKVVEVLGQQFYQDVHKCASAICRLGLQGKHIGIMGNTSYDMCVNMCAVLYTGSVAVVFSKDYTFQELNEYGKIAEIDALIFEHSLEQVCLGAGLDIRLIDNEESDKPGIVSLKKECEQDILDIVNDTHKGDMINILFTSGTTGKSKAVMHTNGSLIAGFFPSLFYDEFSSILVVFPFHHITGYGMCLTGLVQEKTVCIGDGPQKIYKYLQMLKPDCVFVVPALLQVICQKLSNSTQEELGWNLRLLICGGAAVSESLLEITLRTGITIRQMYGASENVGRGISCKVTSENLKALGEADPLMEVKLVDGELAIKGPAVCLGYYNNPEETADTFIDGWYYTGDMARVDENGLYYLTGRKKNLIILSNGENVSPEEIEQKLLNYEEIEEILVQEEKDSIGAVVYPKYPEFANHEQKLTCTNRIDKIIENYNSSVPTYKQIVFVTYTDEPLPKTASGKIIRY